MNEACTQEYLPDFWPGQNLMGKILKAVRTELLEEKRHQQIENEKNVNKPVPYKTFLRGQNNASCIASDNDSSVAQCQWYS